MGFMLAISIPLPWAGIIEPLGVSIPDDSHVNNPERRDCSMIIVRAKCSLKICGCLK